MFKDISIKKGSLYVGQTQISASANASLPADPDISIQQLVDLVKSDFADSELFSDKMPSKGNLRFSVAEYSEEEQRDYVDILKPFTGTVIDRNPEDYAAYLKEHGVDIPEKDAFRFAQEAAGEKMKQARKAADKEAAKQLKLKSLSSILSIWSTRSIKCLSVSNKILTKKTALFRP